MKNLYGESVCIIAPHPDDEVLGLGGSIRKMVNNGIKVNLLVVSGHLLLCIHKAHLKQQKRNV